jgi:hypothetical protein
MDDWQLSYADIALVPFKCIVPSRSCCSTEVAFGPYDFAAPVYPSNMKSVVDQDTCAYLARRGWFYSMHRFDVDLVEFSQFMKSGSDLPISISTGVNGDSRKQLEYLSSNVDHGVVTAPDYITIDVANAWSDQTREMMGWVKDAFPDVFLIVGNVATSNAVLELQKWGADAIKVGIAGGCFVNGSKIKTINDLVNIEDIKIGDIVLTHMGRYRRVVAVSERKEQEKIIRINGGIKCTSNHEIYALHKRYKEIVTDDNIEEYAEWIPAAKLSKDYFLLKIKEG